MSMRKTRSRTKNDTQPLKLQRMHEGSDYGEALTTQSEGSSESFHDSVTEEQRVLFDRSAEQYIENCKRFDIDVDPSVVVALKTGWSILHPSRRFAEGSMLPLLGILDKNDSITKVNLSDTGMLHSRYASSGNGNSNARILNFILQRNKTIEDLDLSNTGLDDDGVKEICEGIKQNGSIKRLSLARNHFGEYGAKYLTEAMKINEAITELDMSRNALGFQSINNLLCICNPKNINVHTFGNFAFEEILNSVSHGVAFLGSVVGAVVLISEAADIYRTQHHFWACTIYSFALMFLFLSSCLFHSFFMLPTTARVLQILDHVGIYFVIAGTYTPFCLIALRQHTSAIVLLSLEWIAALLGTCYSAFADFNNPMTTIIEIVVFCLMGGGWIIIYPLFETVLSREAVMLLLIGGGCYVFGILFFILGEYRPIFHTVWHMFVIVAACIHWFDVYFFVVAPSILDSPTKSAVVDLVDSMEAAANATRTFMSAAANMTSMKHH